MLEDKTYEVKTWDHNDAVIYVTETSSYLKSDPEKNDGTGKWVTETHVVTVVPVNNIDGVDDEFVTKVQETASSLAALYEGSPDADIKIYYTIYAHPYVN
jgi:hypothetical protein